MSVSDRLDAEVERLCALLPAYLCERTGLSMAQVVNLLDHQQTFWEGQPHVMGQMMIFGFPFEDGEEHA